MENTSGIHPTGSLVLILLDPVPESHGSIAMPANIITQNQLAQIRARLVEKGPEATTPLIEGSRIIFRRYAGELVTGSDGVKYRIIQYKDIYATFDRELPEQVN